MPKIKFFVIMLHFKIRHLNVGINIRGFSAIKCDSTIVVFTILNKKYYKYISASKAKWNRRRRLRFAKGAPTESVGKSIYSMRPTTRPVPARPWCSLKAYISERKLGAVLKFSGMIVTIDKIVVCNFQVIILKNSKMTAIFVEEEI